MCLRPEDREKERKKEKKRKEKKRKEKESGKQRLLISKHMIQWCV